MILAGMGENAIITKVIRARRSDFALGWMAALAIPALLIAPAIWNGYPLLQYDTGGYLARWYEGYLVPSRSTVFGLYLHLGQHSYFYFNLALQSLAAFWILQLVLHVYGLRTPFRIAAISLSLIATTALPWLTSMLLTDIFAGLSILSLFILTVHGDKSSPAEKWMLFVFTAFAAASHSATFGVLAGLCCVGWMVRPWLNARIPVRGLTQASLSLLLGAGLLLAANFALSGRLTWTPGGYGVSFGRMMQDGIVARYLNDHCATIRLKLCPYRNDLPASADDFLWGNSAFNKLGRFDGLNDEMEFIVVQSLLEYPVWQVKAAAAATARQLVHVATGEGTTGFLPHTYGIIERYLPDQFTMMRAARQQHWDINFAAINRVHVPVGLASMFLLVGILVRALCCRRFDDLAMLAAFISAALLGNAFICAVISGPHDRYGARLVWLATFTVLVALERFRLHRSKPAASLLVGKLPLAQPVASKNEVFSRRAVLARYRESDERK
jgi:hypothetical protein